MWLIYLTAFVLCCLFWGGAVVAVLIYAGRAIFWVVTTAFMIVVGVVGLLIWLCWLPFEPAKAMAAMRADLAKRNLPKG